MANFVGAGTGVTIATGSGAVTAAGSGVAVGDIVVLQVLQDGVTGSAVSLSGISGVANLAGTASSLTTLAASQAVGTLALQHLWIGRATSTTVTVTVATTGDDLYYRIYVFRGVLRTATTLATILENSTAGTVTNATGTVAAIADTGVTSIGTDRLAVNFVAVDDDNPVGPFTGMTGGTWSEAIAEFASATGTDGCIQLQIADLSAAGTINGGSFTMSAADNWGVVGFAFIPVAVTADTATVGLVFTPSASDTYTPSVPTVDSGTGVLVLTASGVDVYAPSVPTTDSGTVSLLLTVLTTTAFNTYAETGAVLDNFNRADQEPPGGIWGPEPVSSAHTALQVVGNRLSGTVLGNNSGRIAGVDYGPDVFATFEIGTAGNEVMGIYLRIQEVGDTPTAYQITIDLNGLIVMYRQPGGNFLGSIACPAGLVSGDKFGVEMVGSRLRAYVNDISTGLGWVLILERSDSTITAAGEIGVNMTHLTQTIDNLYGGNVPVDTAQYVDSNTGGLQLTASAVEVYTPSVPTTDAGTPVVVLTVEGVDEYTAGGIEHIDSATVTLALTPIVPITTRLLDDFNRANGSIGSNWSTPLLAESQTVLNIASNQAKSQDGTQADNYWNADIFTGDVEASVTVKDYAVGNIILLVINANLSTGSNYLAVIQPSGSGSTADYSIYRVNVSGSYSQIASASGPISVGSNVSLKRVGDTVSIRQNGVQVVSILDTSALSNTGTLYVGLGASATQLRLDDFMVSAPAETFHGVDSAVGVLTLSAAGAELIELVDAAEAAIILTGSSTDVLTAAVTFPTTFVIDNFQRAGGSPGLVGLGSHWGQDTLNLGAVSPDALNGLMYNPSDLYTEIYFNWSPFGPDVEVFFTYAQASGGTSFAFGGMARISNPDSSSVSGYRFLITDADGLVKISKYITGTETVLASTAFTATLGSQYGMSCIGNEITVFEDGVPILSVTDSSIAGSSTNRIGVWSYGGGSSTDEIGLSMFGGGNVGAMSEASEYSDLIIADDAFAYWRLGENGSTVAYDFTNHGWSGLHVTSAADGVEGGIVDDPDLSCQFQQVNAERIRTWISQFDHIYHATSYPGDGMSLECWHYRPASVGDGPKDMGLLGSWNNSTNGGMMLWISYFSGTYSMTVNQTAGDYINSPDDPQLGVWEHVVGVYEQTGESTGVMNLYVNGELAATDSQSPGSMGAPRAFDIATYDQSSGVTLAGLLDEAAVYQYPLTAAQVLEHYEMGTIGGGPQEHVDAATVTLNLDVVAAFPYGQPLLDNFNRADAGTLGSNWIPLVPLDARWGIENGEAFNDNIEWTNDVWAASFGASNIFAWVEIASASAGEGHLWLIQEPNTSTPDGYGMFFNAPGTSTILTRMNNNASLEYLQTVSTPWAVGDFVGISYNGTVLKGYRKAAGSERWSEIASVVVATSGSGIVYPVNYVGLGMEQQIDGWRFTNFGGGSIPSVIELDTFHSVEAATVDLVFTLSAVEEYTTVTGTEYSDSATASVLFTPGVASVAAGATLLDDFNRANSSNWGANWTKVVSRGNTDVKIASNQGYFDHGGEQSYAWNPVLFGSDQEASFITSDIGYNSSRLFFLLCANDPSNGAYTGYLLELVAAFSDLNVNIYRATSNSFSLLGAVSGIAYGGAPFGEGDVWTARKVGDQLSMLRNGVVVAGPYTDPSPLVTGPYWLGVGGNANDNGANTTKIDDFYGGTYGVSTSGETFQGVDAQTVGLVFTPSAVEARDRTDSATVPLAFTVSGTESRDRTDAATVPFTFTVTAVEIRERTEAGTITLVLTASGTELEQVVDSATASVIFTPSGVDDHSAGGVFTDSATASVLFTVSSTEIAGVVDAQTVTATLTPSALEARISTDAATAAVVFTPSTIEAQEALDAATITVRVTGTTVEAKEAQDAATASLGLSPSAAVSFSAVDSALTTLVLSPSAVEDFITGGVFTDAATARLTYTVTSTEAFAVSDSATVSVGLTASGVESYGRTDAATASVLFSVSGVDTYTTASAFTDTGTAAVLFSVTAVEGRERQDTGTATLALTVTYASAHGSTDATTAPLLLTPSALFERATLSTATVPLAFTITSVEEIALEDAATLYFRLTPKTALVFDNPLLLGVLSSTWRGGMQARSYSATVSSPGLSATVTAPRFTATVSTDMTGDIDSHFAGTIRR